MSLLLLLLLVLELLLLRCGGLEEVAARSGKDSYELRTVLFVCFSSVFVLPVLAVEETTSLGARRPLVGGVGDESVLEGVLEGQRTLQGHAGHDREVVEGHEEGKRSKSRPRVTIGWIRVVSAADSPDELRKSGACPTGGRGEAVAGTPEAENGVERWNFAMETGLVTPRFSFLRARWRLDFFLLPPLFSYLPFFGWLDAFSLPFYECKAFFM